MNIDQLQRIMPSAGKRATVFLAPLNLAMTDFGIVTKGQRADFLANIGHESGHLTMLEENLNYSADRLQVVWPKRFPNPVSTAGYARNPVALANKVYAGRMGNGDEKSGDGWRHRGAGLIQLTGLNNHAKCALRFNLRLADVGDWLRTPEGACRSAAWFYTNAGLHMLTNFDHICDLINQGHKTDKVGDSIGYADRLVIRNRALATL